MFLVHAGFMLAGLLLTTAGFTVARFMKSKSWWLRSHKRLQMCGAACLLLGLGAAVWMTVHDSGLHFKTFHAYLGAASVFLTAFTLMLGIQMFQWKTLTLRLKIVHRWSGRPTLVMVWITALSGMRLAGIL